MRFSRFSNGKIFDMESGIRQAVTTKSPKSGSEIARKSFQKPQNAAYGLAYEEIRNASTYNDFSGDIAYFICCCLGIPDAFWLAGVQSISGRTSTHVGPDETQASAGVYFTDGYFTAAESKVGEITQLQWYD